MFIRRRTEISIFISLSSRFNYLVGLFIGLLVGLLDRFLVLSLHVGPLLVEVASGIGCEGFNARDLIQLSMSRSRAFRVSSCEESVALPPLRFRLFAQDIA